jgi:hypothetical protein
MTTLANLQAQIEKLTRENAAQAAELAKKAKSSTLTLKVSVAKPERVVNGKTVPATKGGGLSLYGLQRFPVTLYAENWERLAKFMPEVMAFIAEHPELERKAA